MLANRLESLRAEKGLPSLAFGAVTGNQISEIMVVGKRRIDWEQNLASADDAFCLSSCSKAFTATLAAMLVKDGALDWDSKLRELSPALTVKLHRGLADVSLLDLLTHRSGIQPLETKGPASAVAVAKKFGAIGHTSIERRRTFAINVLSEAPRTQTAFLYSDLGFVIAAAILEDLMAIAWETQLFERIFKPLRFTSATLGLPDADDKGTVHDHQLEGSVLRAHEYSPKSSFPDVFSPAGGIRLSLADFARWAAWNATSGNTANLTVARSFVGSDFDKLFTVMTGPREDVPPPRDLGYGVAWGLRAFPKESDAFWCHFGDNTLSAAAIAIDRRKQNGFVALTNCGGQLARRALAEAIQKMANYL